jgi:CRISPR-associated endoribonuclease Cas6
MYLTAFDATLEITGEKTILKILYKKGIGNRTGEGFGMVDII